ncbi:Long-chain-fatty-acid--CoA ligase ACSBG2 [Myotis brandtii]|uniref:Long-chain-fatty-acid--CoA ligase ACSBG2 n=1 Tax=Myotis brandtii TaxID=109478 RepID=S7NQR4_MYOBR|nr:Long-chain-fatty-acid--CoA ligase ACSBG2 [Myotis brandtii]
MRCSLLMLMSRYSGPPRDVNREFSLSPRGLCVGIYATNSADACQYVIAQAKVNVLMVENDLQLQKILSWDDFMELGNTIPDPQLDHIIASQKANQCAVLIYTSGTTGNPKGVMLSHDNITWLAGTVAKDLKLACASVKQEVVVSYLPLSHVAALMMDIWLPMKVGGCTYFAQPDALKGTLVNTLQEVKPTAFLGVPRVWEKIQAKIKESCAKSSSLKNKVFAWARTVGLKINTKRMQGIHDAPMSYHVAKALVFNRIRNSIGFDHCHLFISGAAPLSPETAEFFLSLDIPIGEMYGMSESSGPHTVYNFDNLRMLSSCGKIASGCKNMLLQPTSDGIGEICMWGRHVFMGYLEKQEETTEIIDEEGWLHSGDLGLMDNQGFLYITGRIKEMLITAGGENVAPVPIENRVKEKIPIVSNALLVGDKAKFLSILLTLKGWLGRKCETDEMTGEPLDKLNWEATRFCQDLGSQASTVSEIVELQDPLVYSAIQKGIDDVNQEATSNAQKIQKWVILEKDFSIYGGELGERPGELWPWLVEAGPQLVQGHVGSETCPILGARGSVGPAGDT